MLVKYDNKLNLLAFKGVSKLEYDLFFAIIARLKEKGTDKLTITFLELTEFIGKNLTNNEISDFLDKSTKKIIQTFIRWETESSITNFTIFKLFKIDKDNATLEVSLNEYFTFMLNNLEQGFSVWELAEFSNLGSKYSQTLYRLLKQFKYTGFLKMDWNYFLEIMDAPKTYKPRDVDNWILKPAIIELSEKNLFNSNLIFKKLSYKKEYYPKRGRPIKSITFTFEPELKEITLENGKVMKDHTESIAHKTRLDIIKNKQLKDKKTTEEQQTNNEEQIKKIDELQEKIKKQKQQEKEQPKKEEPKKTNPITKKQIDWRDEYISRHFKSENKIEKTFDICKIMNIIQTPNGEYQGYFKNQENEKKFSMIFKDEKHFKNWFKKVKIDY